MALDRLLHAIHRLEDLPRLCGALGFTPLWRELPEGILPGGASAAIVGQQGDFTWYGVATTTEGAGGHIARMLAGRGRSAAVLALDESARTLTVASGDAAPLGIALDAPDRLGVARLTRCAARETESPLALSFRIAEALSGRGVDQRFFTAFRRTLSEVTDGFPANIPGTDRHALALLQLTRILFLYFVEAKGWLGGRARFLREEVDRCLASKRSLHRDLLRPLFFGTLNRPLAERGALARRFGAVPFLNGGLFEPHLLERRWRVTLPTPVLRDAFDHLFERFHFTIGTPAGESVAPDMLGMVFERVMEPEERHSSGSYYTPAALVDALLRDGLATWLAERTRVSWPDARRQMDEPDAGTRRTLGTVRLLDPAVGSGAFLLGALRILAGPGGAARRRRILATNLFGVDRNAAAVRLAELRLWLEIVAADPSERPESVAPLPNLDALVRQGDSLHDPTAGLPLRLPSRERAGELGRLRAAVVNASGPAKRITTVALIAAEKRIAGEALEGAVATIEGRIGELLDLARSPTLFGGRRGLAAADGVLLAEWRSARRRARGRLAALRRSGETPWFHYPTHFADVFARGGFDLVVGNPPWVRAEALAPEERRYLAERFRWFRGTRGARQGYAHQPDLAVAFLERSLELLAPGGVTAFLLPAKLATAGYATAAREELTRRTTIIAAADLRHDPRAEFEATVYPMALVASVLPPPEAHRVRLGLDASAATVPQQSLGGSAWMLLGDPAREAIERLRRSFPSLGLRYPCQLGVKTGLNRVFLDPPVDIEPELIRWAVRGRDVRAFAVQRVHRLLWPCDTVGRPLQVLPPAAARYLSQHAGELRRRADYNGGPPWTLFRTRPASAPCRVVWPDVARRLEAAPLVGQGGSELIPLNSCYVVAPPDSATALRVAGWLNCTWSRVIAAATADPATGGFARFNARVVSTLPLPPEVLHDTQLLQLGRAGVAGALDQEALDACCARLLRLERGERAALAGLADARSTSGG
jgi:hypothetical protein